MELNNVLSLHEKTKLQKIAEDKVMVSALKKVFLFGIYYNGTLAEDQDPDPTRNFTFGLMAQSRGIKNEQLGEVLRAQMEAISQVEAGFTQLDKFKKITEQDKPKEVNPAR